MGQVSASQVKEAGSHSLLVQTERGADPNPNERDTAMSLANIIAFVTSAHIDPTTAPEINVDPEVTETVIGRNMPKSVRGKKQANTTGAVAAPIHHKPAVFGVTMPERNTLDAKGFLLACRDAGKRSFEKTNEVTGEVHTIVKRDESKVREDIIKAIHAYVGYDQSRDFGSQEAAARAKANREASGRVVTAGPSRDEVKAASRSVAGYVHGMPLPAQKLLANLRAREQAAAEAMIDAKTDAEKLEHGSMLAQIRAAIDELL
jgi:hypothetical protein